MMNKPLLFLSPIKKKSEYKSGYHRYSHRCGIALLKKAFSHIGKEISENDILMSEKGKPYIDGSKIFFNISHCDGLAVCVLSDKPVGVDCESVRKASTAVMKKCFGKNEADYINNCENRNNAFTRIWTLKESYVKMTGDGVSSTLTDKCFDIDEGRVLFESGAEFIHYDFLLDEEQYFISVSFVTDDKKRENSIEKPFFDIDNEHILLYNVSDN